MEIDNCYESVDRELLELLMMCSQLLTLELNAYLNMSFVEQVLEYCQESRCPLRTFEVSQSAAALTWVNVNKKI